MFKTGLRFVWNLTLRCPEHCSFCAASACQSAPDNPEKKHQILEAILAANLPTEIDFSGGNPWSGEGSLETMMMASKALGKQNISISGLGSSLIGGGQISCNLIQDLASSYDFTYDVPYWYTSSRQGMMFANRSAMNLLRQMSIEYNVTLPFWDFSEQHALDLAQELAEINPHHIKLLQLMPLGRNQVEFYNASPAADHFISLLNNCGYMGEVRKNCAMCGICNGCSDHKLGLDHNGNLYWCIWAADLGVATKDNPFYLGNLLEEPLMEILVRNHKVADAIPRDYCHILAFKSHPTRS